MGVWGWEGVCVCVCVCAVNPMSDYHLPILQGHIQLILNIWTCSLCVINYNPFVSSAHPPIVRDHANVHKIGSHFPVVADRYPWISPSCHSGFDIAATVRKKMVSKNSRSEYYDYRIFLSLLITHVSCIRLIKLWFLNLHGCNLSIWALLLKIVFINRYAHFSFLFNILIKHYYNDKPFARIANTTQFYIWPPIYS